MIVLPLKMFSVSTIVKPNWYSKLSYIDIKCYHAADGMLCMSLKTSFHSGKLSVDWNGQENFSLC